MKTETRGRKAKNYRKCSIQMPLDAWARLDAIAAREQKSRGEVIAEMVNSMIVVTSEGQQVANFYLADLGVPFSKISAKPVTVIEILDETDRLG